MSYISWHNFGYGICVDDIQTKDLERLKAVLKLAPKLDQEIRDWIEGSSFDAPDWDDYMEFDADFYLGLAAILQAVIEEAEGITLTACDDCEGRKYLLYQPCYPWQLSENTRELTQERLDALFRKYVKMLTDEEVEVSYQEVENGG